MYTGSLSPKLATSYIRSCLDGPLLSQLKLVYSLLYPTMNLEEIDFNTTFRRYSSVTCRGINFSSKRNNIIYAIVIPDHSNSTPEPRPVILHYFVMHTLNSNGIARQHLLAAVSWLKQHPAKYHYEKPLEVWWKDLIDYHQNMFVPIQLLICHAVHSDIKHEEQTVFLMCPVRNIPVIM